MNRSRRALARIPLTASVYPCIPDLGAVVPLVVPIPGHG